MDQRMDQRVEQKVDQKKLRRYEHSLAISGAGMIMFGSWNIIKTAVFFVITPIDKVYDELTHDMDIDWKDVSISEDTCKYLVLAAILMLLLFSLMLRLFIGRAAIQEGRRIRRRRAVYVVLAALIGAVLLFGIVARVIAFLKGVETLSEITGSSTVSIFVDVTSFFCALELVIAAIMVRRLRKGAA